MTILILASLAFMAAHAVPSTRLRPHLVSALGGRGYRAAFSLVSLVLLALMVHAYNNALPAPPLWVVGAPLRVVIALLMLVPFWLALAAGTEPNPAAIGGENVLEISAVPRGVFTLTRHPMMVAVALWAALHLIANTDLPSLIFFGSLIATALGGAWAQDRRKEREIGAAWRRYLVQTSLMPLRAIAEGRTRFDSADLTWWRLALALALWLAVLTFHGDIFAVPALV